MRNKIDRWTVTGTLILGTMLFLTGALEDGRIDRGDVRAAGLFTVLALAVVVVTARHAEAQKRSDFEEGWHAITRYTGATVGDVVEAIAAGELRCTVSVRRPYLDAWLWARGSQASASALCDERVELIP